MVIHYNNEFIPKTFRLFNWLSLVLKEIMVPRTEVPIT